MTLREVYEQAILNESYWLQMLIEFLVFDKEVHTFEDDRKELDRYFLPQHHERMNEELTKYVKKMEVVQ